MFKNKASFYVDGNPEAKIDKWINNKYIMLI